MSSIKQIIKVAFFVLLFLLNNSCKTFVSKIRSNNGVFYIDPENFNDRYQNGSIDHPFDSWIKITNNDLWSKGTVFLQKCGTVYRKSLFLIGLANGFPDNPIIIGAYGKGVRPKIIANGLYAISIRDCKNWIIRDFDLSGATSQVLQIYAQNDDVENVKILNCHINGSTLEKKSGKHCVQARNKNGINDLYHINNIEIAYNLIENAGDTNLNSDGIYLGAVKSNAYIHHNIIQNNSGNGIDIAGGSNHIAEFNKLINNAGSKAHGQQYPLISVVIRNNLIVQHKSIYYNSFGLSLQDSFNGKLYNNTVYLNNLGTGAFILCSFINPKAFTGNIIINNIFYGSSKGRAAVRILPELVDRFEKYNNIFDNNIISNQRNSNYIIIHMKQEKENSFYINKENIDNWMNKHKGDLLVDFCFTNPEKDDFTLDKKVIALGVKPRKDLVGSYDIKHMGADLNEINKINFKK